MYEPWADADRCAQQVPGRFAGDSALERFCQAQRIPFVVSTAFDQDGQGAFAQLLKRIERSVDRLATDWTVSSDGMTYTFNGGNGE